MVLRLQQVIEGPSHELASSSSSLATRYLLMLADLYSPVGFPHGPLKQRSQSFKHETSTCQVRTFRWDYGVSQLQAILEEAERDKKKPQRAYVPYSFKKL